MSFIADLAGSLIGADATKDAAYQQAQSGRDANALQKYIYDQTRTDNAPALSARNSALTQLQAMLGNGGMNISAADVQAEPGYQFGLNQGNQNIQNSAAAKGGLYSGQAMKALTQYGNDYASTKYDAAFNRKQAAINPLLSMAGLGQTAANTNASSGSNYANQAGNNITGAGNASAAATLAQSNIWGNLLNKTAAGGWGSGTSGTFNADPGGADMSAWWN